MTQNNNPTPAEVKAAREAIQIEFNIGITAAQDWCAAALHTQRRPFQHWELGERKMHPAFWELLKIKVAAATAKSIGHL